MYRKRGMVLSALLIGTLFLSGCSFTDTMQSLVNRITKDTPEESAEIVVGEGRRVEPQVIDSSLDKPVFDETLVRALHVPLGTPATLEVKATVNDGGSVGYQWFSNNVDANGGGSVLEGAGEATYAADTSKSGTTFYYVVATNTKEGRNNLATSPVYSVTVWEDMYWQQSADTGAYQYMSRVDGKFPTSTTMTIDGTEYQFNAEGYAVTAEGDFIDVQTGKPIATPTPDATPTPTPEPEEDEAEEGAEENTEEVPEEATEEYTEETTEGEEG